MNQFPDRSKEIQQLVADDNLGRAITRLFDFIKDFAEDDSLQSEAILISANHKKLIREERQNLIDSSSANLIRSKIIAQLLHVHKDVCSGYQSRDTFVSTPQASAEPENINPSYPFALHENKSEPGALPSPDSFNPEKSASQSLDDPKAEEDQPDKPEFRGETQSDTTRLEHEPDLNQLHNARQESFSAAPQNIQATRESAILPPHTIPLPGNIVCQIHSLSKTYKKSGFQLSNLNLEIRQNEIIGIVGENGNGKTTLFKIITGELKHDAGFIIFPAFNENNPRALNWINIKNQIAYVEQELPLWYGSLKNNLHYEAACHNLKSRANEKEVEYILHRLGLIEHINKRWDQLSGGYKLRFSLAKALVWKPKFLVLDEPLANLDINAQLLVMNDLRDLANSIRHPVSILVSSQHLHEVEHISDKILFIKNGKSVFYGHKSDLGNDRQYNYFEVQSTLPKDTISEGLHRIKIIDISHDGMYYQIVTPKDIAYETLLREMMNNHISFSYFRDISKSTKKLFV